MADKQQHVEYHRKLKLRRELMEKAGALPGAFYIPFIGEGDIAVELYSKENIYGADIDATMVETAKKRLPRAEIIVADCDTYPYKKSIATFSLADFDAYCYPYDSFRSFFEGAKIGSQCVVIFTDAQRQAILRSGSYRTPDGVKQKAKTVTEKRKVYNFYFNKVIMPWFEAYIKPYHIVYITKYLRDASMCYWGAIIERDGGKSEAKVDIKIDKTAESHRNKFDAIKKAQYIEHISNGHTRGYAATLVGVHRATISNHMNRDHAFAEAVSVAESDAIGKVEHALHEAATSGNITAIQVFLYNRDPKRWSDRRNIQLAAEVIGSLKVEVDAKGKLLQILNRLAERKKQEGEKKPS